jgi:small subunit ribosomal protein S3
MGQKVHPIGFRLGIVKDWVSKWYADRDYPDMVQEDLRLRRAIDSHLADAGVPLVEIERSSNQLTITVHTSKPGVVIGKGGQRVDELRAQLEDLTGKRVRLNIQEIRQPELNAYLVAKSIAEQLERRVSHKRAMKQALSRTMQRGAKGIKILCSGRLGGAEMARRDYERAGQVPLHTLRADIDYGQAEALTTFGRIGVKVWIYKGDILPEAKQEHPKLVESEEAVV